MLPDRWNPRLWLRDWLNRSSPRERAAAASFAEQLSAFMDSRINTTAQGNPKAVAYGPFHVVSGKVRIDETNATRGESR
ncbi:hypothetical protein [Stenotrophomonas maltophilia]|uniref:hypothetical protein n=1 Tax=Stenotrophomonas maltophilia TaxID=40324 RepID=UPI0012FE21EA|nr:hypothetical protein [Stenotrophomonas maltophilia]